MSDTALWRVEVGLPDAFLALDVGLDPEVDRAAVEAAVEAHLGGRAGADDRAMHAAFVTRAVDVLGAARASGAIGAAIALDLADGEPVHAYVALHCVEAQEDPTPEALGKFAGALGTRGASDVGPAEITIVDIGGRPAVRRAGFAVLDPRADTSPVVATRQYWVPIAGTGSQLVVSCSTPHLDAADALGELFDSIAVGMRIR